MTVLGVRTDRPDAFQFDGLGLVGTIPVERVFATPTTPVSAMVTWITSNHRIGTYTLLSIKPSVPWTELDLRVTELLDWAAEHPQYRFGLAVSHEGDRPDQQDKYGNSYQFRQMQRTFRDYRRYETKHVARGVILTSWLFDPGSGRNDWGEWNIEGMSWYGVDHYPELAPNVDWGNVWFTARGQRLWIPEFGIDGNSLEPDDSFQAVLALEFADMVRPDVLCYFDIKDPNRDEDWRFTPAAVEMFREGMFNGPRMRI